MKKFWAGLVKLWRDKDLRENLLFVVATSAAAVAFVFFDVVRDKFVEILLFLFLSLFVYLLLLRIRNYRKRTHNKTDTVYADSIEDRKKTIEELIQEKSNLEQKLADADTTEKERDSLNIKLQQKNDELNAIEKEKNKLQEELAVFNEIERAITPIIDSVNADKDLLEKYKRQSTVLLFAGSFCFIVALYIGLTNIPAIELLKDFNVKPLLPGFLFAIVGTVLLRHDWKIRQMILKLVEQNNQVDLAMGLLQTSLSLDNIGKDDTEKKGDLPDMVKETFVEVRRALLLRGQAHSSEVLKDRDGNLAQTVTAVVKAANQTKGTS